MGPSTNFDVFGSTPMAPEQKIMPLQMIAWEFEGLGGGAPVVLISVLSAMSTGKSLIQPVRGFEGHAVEESGGRKTNGTPLLLVLSRLEDTEDTQRCVQRIAALTEPSLRGRGDRPLSLPSSLGRAPRAHGVSVWYGEQENRA